MIEDFVIGFVIGAFLSSPKLWFKLYLNQFNH